MTARLFWFAIGAGTAALWMKPKEKPSHIQVEYFYDPLTKTATTKRRIGYAASDRESTGAAAGACNVIEGWAREAGGCHKTWSWAWSNKSRDGKERETVSQNQNEKDKERPLFDGKSWDGWDEELAKQRLEALKRQAGDTVRVSLSIFENVF